MTTLLTEILTELVNVYSQKAKAIALHYMESDPMYENYTQRSYGCSCRQVCSPSCTHGLYIDVQAYDFWVSEAERFAENC